MRPELVLHDEDTLAIERMCTRLDGLPLALELAAARMSVFSPRALEARLAEGLPLPAGPRDLPERQRTLRATIDWSYRLLDPAEQSRWRALSPFVGGVRLDTAEQLWGYDADEGVVSLAEKSLVRRREDDDGEARFWKIEMIRQYASEIAVPDGDAAAADDEHARFYYVLTENARPHLTTAAQREWLDRLEREHANLRAALEHLTEQGSDRALRMVSTLTWFWEMRGYQPEARRRLSEVLARAPIEVPPAPMRSTARAGWHGTRATRTRPNHCCAKRSRCSETTQTRASRPRFTRIWRSSPRCCAGPTRPSDFTSAGSPSRGRPTTIGRLGVALSNYALFRTQRPDLGRAPLAAGPSSGALLAGPAMTTTPPWSAQTGPSCPGCRRSRHGADSDRGGTVAGPPGGLQSTDRRGCSSSKR